MFQFDNIMMKISKLILLVVAVLATSNCLTMHTAGAQYSIYKPYNLNGNSRVTVMISDDWIMFKGCNYNSANVTKDSEGTYTFSKWSAGLGYCARDNDPKIRSLFESVKTSK